MQLIHEAYLNYPSLRCQNGKVVNGMHRVCKALMVGASSITAQQFSYYIAPDYINVDPNSLPND
ncbi:hypothetical protein [uncultured Shewanella sp.]|uniref:hypothetical protein n=1 Tax=uncultured Shewanella sp. TaxID=173975 RepID=UPI002611E551|nr:hypothetical protein [uncultured Shewanella sp.]